jgi:hypothetical protein
LGFNPFRFFVWLVAAKNEGSPKKKWETIAFIIGKVELAFIGVIWITFLSGLGVDYERRFFTFEGFLQAIIVLIIPTTMGVWKAIKENRETVGKFEESEKKVESNKNID